MAPYQSLFAEALAAPLSRRKDIYENTQGRQYRTVITVLCFVPPVVVLRIISRCIHRMPFNWDDLTLILGFMLGFTSASMALMGIHNGVGRHIEVLTPDQVVIVIKSIYAFQVTDALSLACLKFSVMCLLYRIFPTKSMRIGMIIVGILVAGWFFPTIILAILPCNPPSKQWDQTKEGSCIDSRAYMLGGGIAHLATDVCILALPVKPILDLHVATGRKVLIAFAFLSGIFTTAISIVRLLLQFEYTEKDAPFTIADEMAWCIVEISFGIISCCLPTLMPLVNRILPSSAVFRKLFSNTQDKSYGSAAGGTGRRTKQSGADQNDDYEQPLTVSSDSKDVFCDDYSWETHRPKGDQLGFERHNSSNSVIISKSPKAHEPDIPGVELDDFRGIRVMQEVDIMDHRS